MPKKRGADMICAARLAALLSLHEAGELDDLSLDQIADLMGGIDPMTVSRNLFALPKVQALRNIYQERLALIHEER